MEYQGNAVIYARYSSHNQTERSIEGQLQDCYEYAERCGLKVVGEYIDRAITGKTDNRADFQRMISDSAKKQFSFIIVYKLDRFARNRYDSAIYKNKIKRYGIRVLSAMEQISDTPEGIILESMLEGMAEYYSANLSQNVKRGMRVAIQNKTYVGGHIPYGYKLEGKYVVVDDKAAPVVKWIFKQYADGMSKKEIVDELNRKGHRTVNGKEFTVNSFSTMLRNKKYIGIYTFDGEEIHDIYPAIIDIDTFQKVQQQLDRHKRAPAEKKATVDYALTGKLFCGHCGSPMIGDMGTGKLKKKYYYYTCSKKKKKPSACDKAREQKGFVEWYVVEQTLLYVLNEKCMNHIADLVVAAYNMDYNDDVIKNYERQIEALDRELDKLVDLALEATNKAVIKKVDERANAIEAQKSELSLELTKIKIAAKAKLTKEDVIKWIKALCAGDPLSPEFRQRIIDTFINAVYLYDDKIMLYYNFRDGKQVSYIDSLKHREKIEQNKSSTRGKGSDFKRQPPPNRKRHRQVSFFVW